MKKLVLFPLICLVAFLAGSCKKDDESQGTAKNSHRIKERLYTSSSSVSKTVYTYTGEKITQSLDYYGYKSSLENWIETGKSEYVYENNKVTQTRFTYSGGSWVPMYQYMKTFSNSKLIEQSSNKFVNNEWVPEYRLTYQYSGGKLVQEEFYYTDNNGGLILEERIEYTYANNKCVEFLVYSNYTSGSLELNSKATLSYSGDKLSEIVWYSNYYGTWEKINKNVYTYADNLLNNVKNYNWDNYNSTWATEANTSEFFEYDANGYLTKETNTYSYSSTYVFEYTYEAGNGNGQMLFSYPMYDIYGYPVIRKSVTGLPSDIILDPSFR